MVSFTREELKKIAQLSALSLSDQEIEKFTQQITSVLEYVEQIQNVDTSAQTSPARKINVFADDIPQKFDAALLLEQAPDQREGYFTMPRILDEK